MDGFCVLGGFIFGGCGFLLVGFFLLGGWVLGGQVLVFGRWVPVLGLVFWFLGGL